MSETNTFKPGNKVRYIQAEENGQIMTISHANRARPDLWVCKYFDNATNTPKEVTVNPKDLVLVSQD